MLCRHKKERAKTKYDAAVAISEEASFPEMRTDRLQVVLAASNCAVSKECGARSRKCSKRRKGGERS